MACGGDEGLLKIVKIEDERISLNRTLTGHQGKVVHVAWNPRFCRLASADENGLIIVWQYKDDLWCEEMVNNRNQSFVTDVKWTKKGKHIGIVYQDGNIVVGSVEGERIWGQEVNVPLKKIAWCPENRTIIFVTAQNEAKIYDHQGYYIDDLEKVLRDDLKSGENVEITDIDWYDGESAGPNSNGRSLAILYSNGYIQLMRDANDLDPICMDADMDTVVSCAWNPSGEYLAICGYGGDPSVGERVHGSKGNLVNFFDSKGKNVFSLKLPGKGRISGQSWEGSGMRLAIVIGGCIHLVSVKYKDKWASDRKRIVFVPKTTKHTQKVVIKDHDNETIHTKSLTGTVIAIHMVGDKVGIVIKECLIKDQESVEKKEVSKLMLCDETGYCWKSKQIHLEAYFTAMSTSYFVIADCRYLYLWRIDHHDINNPFADNFLGIERIFDVCDTSEHPAKVVSTFRFKNEKVSDSITAICLSDELLCASRFDGGIDLYILPLIHHIKRKISYSCTTSIVSMQFNCDTTNMSLIDSSNVFRMAAIEYDNEIKHCHDVNLKLFGNEKKDVWMVMWSKDEARACAIMDKANIVTLHIDTQSYLEHHIGQCSKGYITDYAGMEVTLLTTDQLSECNAGNFTRIESKQLAVVQQCIEDLGEKSFAGFYTSTHHPKLWKLLARHSLECMNFKSAVKAFVMSRDYKGLSFIDRTSLFSEKAVKRAEIAIFLGNYEEAEKIFHCMSRPDLAVKMRYRLRDYDAILRLLSESTLSSHEWNEVGDHFIFSKQFEKATKVRKDNSQLSVIERNIRYKLKYRCLVLVLFERKFR